MAYEYKYPRPAVTTDAAVFGRHAGGVDLLLIQRGEPPFRGSWALPGGFIEIDEELEAAALRELQEETGLRLAGMRQVGAFGAVDRDPRHRTISIVFYAVVDRDAHPPTAGDDAHAVAWHPLNGLPALAFDHDQVVVASCAAAGLQRSSEAP